MISVVPGHKKKTEHPYTFCSPETKNLKYSTKKRPKKRWLTIKFTHLKIIYEECLLTLHYKINKSIKI